MVVEMVVMEDKMRNFLVGIFIVFSFSVAKAEGLYTVKIVLSSKCPCAGRMMGQVKSLLSDYKGKAEFQFIDVGSLDQASSDRYKKNFQLDAEVIYDKDTKIADALGAEVSPTAFVFNSKHELLYKGAVLIENYNDYEHSAQPLRDALQAAVAGKTIAKKEVPAEGCFIHADILDAK